MPSPSSSSSPPSAPHTPSRVIIVGAGWYGIAAAKTYLEIDPNVSLTVIDADSTVGGTWSKARIYPGLVADSPSGSFEFSDLSMEEELGLEKWTDVDGEAVYKYLESYARKYGVLERCRFETEVVKIRRQGEGWGVAVRAVGGAGEKTELLRCDKLVIATGLTSIPVIPDIETNTFSGKVFHSKDVGKATGFLTSEAVDEVVVLGGNKSALEACKLCVLAGKKVSWIIREEGAGPGLFLNGESNGTNVVKINFQRWGEIMKPGVYAHRGFWHWLLFSGRSNIGTWINTWFWTMLMEKYTKDRYEKSENAKRLKPNATSFFWATGASIIHKSDEGFMDLLNEGDNITVIRANITSASDKTINLSNGSHVIADALIFATGWDVGADPMFDPADRVDLGLATPVSMASKEYVEYWDDINAAADKFIVETYPVLQTPPRAHHSSSTPRLPYRLFRSMVPSQLAAQHDRSLIFLGLLANATVPTHAEVSSLWGISYLENLLPDGACEGALGDRLKMDKDIALSNAFMARRYPIGERAPSAGTEIASVVDRLMKDLELRWQRKKVYRPTGFLGLSGWYREYFEPYLSDDYRGIIGEFSKSGNGADKKRV